MPGIDRYHRKLSYNSGLRKNVRLYKKVGIHIFEIFVASSFYLYMKNTTWPKFSTLKEYKKAIIRVLVGPAKSSLKIKPPANFHYLCAIPITEKKKTRTRTCKHCSTKENRKDSKSVSEMPWTTSIVHWPIFLLVPQKDWCCSNGIISRKWPELKFNKL